MGQMINLISLLLITVAAVAITTVGLDQQAYASPDRTEVDIAMAKLEAELRECIPRFGVSACMDECTYATDSAKVIEACYNLLNKIYSDK